MMKLIVVGTGSSGNTYLLTNGEETLVLDCGCRFLEVKKAMDFNIRGIVGAVVTHRHGDHHAFAHEYEDAGIPVWKPYEMENLRQSTQFGGFRIQSFEAIHSVPTVGYLIGHKDIGKMLYATDTAYLKYCFGNLSVILIEANYSEAYVNRDEPKYAHVITGHMSIETCMQAVSANITGALKHIILCHLSGGNSNASEFLELAKRIAPAGCTVDVAKKGLAVNLGEIPF
jgi:ribonuclease BN (tRNA processing enzyme)